MKRLFHLVIVFCVGLLECAFLSAIDVGQPPTVEIPDGKIQGMYKKSSFGRTFASFTKIPFAKPPIGNLRFRAPEAPEPWQIILDATEEVPKCLQKDYVSYAKPNVEGTEDCLYLNVYTPGLKSKATIEGKPPSPLLPVMVFIHWGANTAGTSKSTILGPEYYMNKDVILVTFNYRVGILGFFSTLNDDAPGNWAAKDQIMALRWVQKNIEYFGGDKNRVTIFGQSAGAGAVHHLILSPQAKGLFHGGISQSGAALCLWAKPLNAFQEKIYPAAAQILGCDPSNTTSLMECMRNVDGSALVSVVDAFKYFFREPLVMFMYVIEKKTALNPEPFLEDDPANIIARGDFSRVPWIIGTVQEEGALKTGPYLIDPESREELIARFDEVMPQNLLLDASFLNSSSATEFWGQMKNFYLSTGSIDLAEPETIHEFTNMYGDRAFYYGIYQSALFHAKQGHGPIWFYNFNYRGSRTYADSVFMQDIDSKLDFDFGVSHCDDLLYTFYSPELFPDYKLNATELELSKVMITLWTNFAKTGNPHKQWVPLPNLQGSKSATNSDLVYLDIRGPKNLALRNNYRRKFMKFWLNAPLLENSNVPGLQ